MNNLFEFLRMFLSYGLLFILCVTIVVVATIIGIKLRKNKNIKEASINAESSQAEN